MSISRSRFTIGLAILVAIAGCNDASRGPVAPVTTEISAVTTTPMMLVGAGLPVLRQSPTAPPLETYQVSFWAVRGKDTDIRVNYLPVGDEKPEPFLRFRIHKEGLAFGVTGEKIEKKDSVWMTLTIDPVAFDVHFEPSGVKFKLKQPAELTLWYTHADRDLNGDGVVDAAEEYLLDHLALYYITPERDKRLQTKQDTHQQWIKAKLLHYSQYAVSW